MYVYIFENESLLALVDIYTAKEFIFLKYDFVIYNLVTYNFFTHIFLVFYYLIYRIEKYFFSQTIFSYTALTPNFVTYTPSSHLILLSINLLDII